MSENIIFEEGDSETTMEIGNQFTDSITVLPAGLEVRFGWDDRIQNIVGPCISFLRGMTLAQAMYWH